MFDAGILGLLERLGQPHGIFARLWELLPLQFGQRYPCGSELARDGGGSGEINVDCDGLIASKLAPQFFMHIRFAGVFSAVPFAGRGSGILARFVMPCWLHG